MLRSGYSSDAVLRELSTRKFADVFDSNMEKEFLKAGATQSLIETFRSGAYQLSGSELIAAKENSAAQSRVVANAKQSSNLSPVLSQPTALTKAPVEQQVGGTMYDHFKDDLVVWRDGILKPVDNESLEKKKFYLLFFSAIWSKEGRQFTPQLADYYNRAHQQHPEFEIVFFSADRSAFAMENYVSQTQMPWPLVGYDKLSGKAGALSSAFTNQIPRLILADASGKVLSDSGEGRPDFDKVLTDLDKVLAAKN